MAVKITAKANLFKNVIFPLKLSFNIFTRGTLVRFPILHSKIIIPKVWPNNKVTTNPAIAKGNINKSGMKIIIPGSASNNEYNRALIDSFLIEKSGVSTLLISNFIPLFLSSLDKSINLEKGSIIKKKNPMPPNTWINNIVWA